MIKTDKNISMKYQNTSSSLRGGCVCCSVQTNVRMMNCCTLELFDRKCENLINEEHVKLRSEAVIFRVRLMFKQRVALRKVKWQKNELYCRP